VFYLAKLADSYSDFKKIIINTNIWILKKFLSWFILINCW
jgi:hypothetical protein